jgi:serine protease Do
VNDARTLARRISTLSPGASVKLTLVRGGKEEVVTLTLGEMPKERQANAGTQERELNGADVPKLGLSLAPGNQVAGSSGEGVVVTQVDPDGPAAERGFKTGDVILDVGGATVSTPNDVKKALADAKGAGKKTVLMRVKSEGGTRFVALPIGTA